MLDLTVLNQTTQNDIMEYCEEYEVSLPSTKREVLEAFLNYNGIYGYTSSILAIMNMKE